MATESPWVVAAPHGVILGHHSLKDAEVAYKNAAADSTVGPSGQDEYFFQAQFLYIDDPGSGAHSHLFRSQTLENEVSVSEGCQEVVRGFEVSSQTDWNWGEGSCDSAVN